MQTLLYKIEKVVRLIVVFFSVQGMFYRAVEATTCDGSNYVVPEELRCSPFNVAAAVNGGVCAASSFSGLCSKIIDGSTTSGDAYASNAQTHFVTINFTREFLIDHIRVMQRSDAKEQYKKLKLEFQGGISTKITLRKNPGSSSSAPSVWDSRPFPLVSTSWVKVSAIEFYSTADNGFKEIQFWNSNCIKHKLCDYIHIPQGKTSYAGPLFGQTLFLHAKANCFKVHLYNNRNTATSKRYTFTIDDNSKLNRSEDGSAGTEEVSVTLTTKPVVDNAFRVVWIDFRGAVRVLGSGSEKLLYFSDPNPFDVGYVALEASCTDLVTTICHREDKCHADADHFWPLDKNTAGLAQDLSGQKTGQTDVTLLTATPAYAFYNRVFMNTIKTVTSDMQHVQLGDFTSDPISDLDRAQGLTVCFWLNIQSGQSGDLTIMRSRDTTDRGFIIKFKSSTAVIAFDFYSSTTRQSVEVKVTLSATRHYCVVWRGNNRAIQVLVNGAEYKEGAGTAVSSTNDDYTYLTVGGLASETGHAIMGYVAIWKTTRSISFLQQVFSCTGIRAGSISGVVSSKMACGWVGITETTCRGIGCWFTDGQCHQQEMLYLAGGTLPKLQITRFLSDDAFTSSSHKLESTRAAKARLRGASGAHMLFSKVYWSPAVYDSEPYLQIDMAVSRTFDKVFIQGSSDSDVVNYVKTFTLDISTACAGFTSVKENGAVKVFSGNSDATTIVTVTMPGTQTARCVRVRPRDYQVAIAMKFDIEASENGNLYLGCHTSIAPTAAGNYKSTEMTPDKCIRVCGILLGQAGGVAAIRNGDQCFCSSSTPSAANAVGDSLCNTPCSKNRMLRCGGPDQFSVYTVTEDFSSSFSCDVPRNVSSLTIIRSNCTSTGDKLRFDPYETRILTVDAANFPYSWHQSAADLPVTVTARKGVWGEYVNVTWSRLTKVYDLPVGEHGCPVAVEAGKEFCCDMTFTRGTDMRVRTQFTGGNPVDEEVCDVYGVDSGEIFEIPSGGSAALEGDATYLFPDLVFSEEAQFVGFEIMAESGGCLIIMVARPICGRDQNSQHCFTNGTCETQPTVCSQTSTCSPGETFTTDKGWCTLDGTITENTILKLGFDRLEVVYKFYVCLSGPGRHIINFAPENVTDVRPADVIAIKIPSVGAAKLTNRVSNSTVHSPKIESVRFSARNFSVGDFMEKSGGSIVYIQISVLVFYRVRCQFALCHTFAVGEYDPVMTITTAHTSADVTYKPHIIATVPIDGINSTYNDYATVNKTSLLTIIAHKGYNVTYVVRFGDGNNETRLVTNASIEDTQFEHTYMERAERTLTISAFNSLSYALKTCTVKVIHAIDSLEFYEDIPPTNCTNVTQGCIVIRGGDGVNVTVDFGDGQTLFNGTFDITGIFVGCIKHTYASIGVYNFSVYIENHVSNFTVWRPAIVECPIENLACTVVHANRDIEVNETITMQMAMTEGTTPTFEVDWGNTFDVTQAFNPNNSYSVYQFYNISVSAYNNVSRANCSQEIQVHKPVFPLLDFDITCNCTNLTFPSPCNLTIQGGTDFECRWKFGTNESVVTSWRDLGNETLFTFEEIGHHEVCVNCTNRLYDTYNCTTAIVEKPVTGISMPHPGSRRVDLTMDQLLSITVGTDANFSTTIWNIYHPDIQATVTKDSRSSNEKLQSLQTFSFNSTGQYGMRGEVWNCVSRTSTELVFHVDRVLKGELLTRKSPECITTGTVGTFLFNLTEGTNFTCVTEFGDGNTQKENVHGDFSSPLTFTNTFVTSAFRDVTVRCNNSLSNVTTQSYIKVQDPHKSMSLVCDTPQALPLGEVNCTINVATGTLPPTNSSCSINDGNGVTVTKEFHPPLRHTVKYTRNGSYDVIVNCSNCVDNITLATSVEVQVPVSNCSMRVLYKGPNDGTFLPGKGTQQHLFPLEPGIKIEVACEKGTNVTYTCQLGDGQSMHSRMGVFQHTYPEPNNYNPHCTISNAYNSIPVTRPAHMRKSVLGLTKQFTTPMKLGETTSYIIDGQMGTTSCFYISIGNGTAYLYKYNSQPCPENCNFPANAKEETYSGFPITFTHKFSNVGSYAAKVYGCNEISDMNATGTADTAVVAYDECYNPLVEMNANQANGSEAYAPQYLRSRNFTVCANTVLNCKATQESKKSWEIHTCDETGNCAKLKDAPKGQCVKIIARSLEYGLYKLIHTVEMVGPRAPEGIKNHTYGFVRVTRTPLECPASTQKKVGQGKSIAIATNDYKDPDVVSSVDDTKLKFYFFCAKTEDNFTVAANSSDLPALSIVPHPYFTSSASMNASANSTANATMSHGGGCFGYGDGRLNVTGKTLTVTTRAMRIKTMYTVTVLIKKDQRFCTSSFTLDIADGDPPEVSINTVGGESAKVNPTFRIAFAGSVFCSLGCGWGLTFRWNLRVRCLTKSTEWTTVNNFAALTSTGTGSQNLVIKGNQLEGGCEYSFRSSVTTFQGSEGYIEKIVKTNLAPFGGRCGSTPREGDSKTSFMIWCKDWEDDDVGSSLVYTVRCHDLAGGFITTCATVTGDPSDLAGQVSVNISLLAGVEKYGFNQSISVIVSDTWQTSRTISFNIKVKAVVLSTEEAKEVLNPQSLELAANSGNPEVVSAMVLTVIFVAGSLSTSTTSDPGQDDAEAKKVAEESFTLAVSVLVDMECTSAGQATTQMIIMGQAIVSPIALSAQLKKNMIASASSNLGFMDEANPEQKQELAAALINVASLAVVTVTGTTTTTSGGGGEAATQPPSPEELEKERKEEQKQTEAMLTMTASLSVSLLVDMVEGEPTMVIFTATMTIAVSKSSSDAITDIESFKGLNGIFGASGTSVSSMFNKAANNLYSKAEGAPEGSMVSLSFKGADGEPVDVNCSANVYFDVFIDQKRGTTLEPELFEIGYGECNCHSLEVRSNQSAIFVEAIPNIASENLTIFLYRGPGMCHSSNPALFNFTTMKLCNASDASCNATEGNTMNSTNAAGPYKLFVPYEDIEALNITSAGFWTVKICHNDGDVEPETCTGLSYNFSGSAASCKFYNKSTETWSTSGCKVGPKTTLDQTHCQCCHLTSFAGDFFVAPNKIDWNKITADEILKNPLVFSVVLGIVGLYLLLVIWARRMDRKDLEKVGLTPLPDNDPRDTYLYEVVIYTGHHSGSGTSSEVRMVLSGGLDETSPRLLKDPDPQRRKFCKGNVDYFLLAVPRSLGKLKNLRIWHSNSGDKPSWYLLRVMIHDLQTGQKTWFINDRWLAVEEDDGMVERTITPATKKELTSFNLLFSTEARKNLTDGHLWFSVVARPAKSNFTRVQRLTCCLSVMLSTMLANCMFYQVDDESSSGTSIRVGPLSFSIKQLSIAITSSMVVLPVNILIVTIFRKIRPPDPKKNLNKDQDPNNQSGKYEMEKSVVKMKAEVEEEEQADGEKDKEPKPKKKFSLNPRFVFLAYGLAFLSVSVSACFTIFYGLTFGKTKSEAWLSSMMISFWQDVLVSQPLKVFAMAMFFALIIKDPNKAEDENEGGNDLTQDEELIHDNVKNSEEEKTLRKLGFVDKPPNPEKLEAARRLKLKQKEMKTIIHEILQYMFFLVIVLVIAYGNRDPKAYNVTMAMEDYFVNSEYTGMASFVSTGDYTSYWDWVKISFIPTLKPRFWYGPVADFNVSSIEQEEFRKARRVLRAKRGKSKAWKSTTGNYVKDPSVLFVFRDGFTADHETAYMVGSPRLRQLRVKRNQCVLLPFLRPIFPECNVGYGLSEEESSNFNTSWKLYGPNYTTDENNKTPWTYRGAWELKGTPYWGQFASYWGGGYVADFGTEREKAVKLAETLESQQWIDKYTRALFAEFAIYNAAENFFSVVTLLTEILPTGGYYHWPRIQTLRLYRYIGPEMVFVMACEIMYLAFLLFFMYKQIKKYRAERKEYWKDAWNYLELLVLGFSLSAMGLYFARLALTKYTISNMKETPNQFVSFQYVAFLDEWVTATTSLAVFFSFLKFLRLLRFNRKMALLTRTLKAAAAPLAYFFIYFSVIFFAYAQFAFVVFGISIMSYATFQGTMASLFGLTLGDFDFDELKQANRLFGPLFFFSYVVLVLFILVNVFLSIIVETFNMVNSDVSKQANDHEILDFMLHTVKANIGKHVGPAIKPTYVEPKTTMELQLDDIEDISDNVQYAFRNICMEDIRQSNWFEVESSNNKKKIVMKMMMEADENFTENDICDSIPIFEDLMSKSTEEDLIRLMITYREKRKVEETEGNESDTESNSSEGDSDEDSDSEAEKDSDEEKTPIPRATSRLEESIMDDIINEPNVRPKSQAELNEQAISDVFGDSTV